MKILVAEGNVQFAREWYRSITGETQGEQYASVIKSLSSNIQVDILNLPDSDQNSLLDFDRYEGIVLTGSSLNVYNQSPEVERQIKFARRAFDSQVPFFGSCWGLQVANVAAGGEVELNHRGPEVGVARRVSLTDLGAQHPMHKGRKTSFDALAIHSDHVTRQAEGMSVTATNEISEVQAAEILYKNGCFWGAQFHPEYSLNTLADVLGMYDQTLISNRNLFLGGKEFKGYIEALRVLHKDSSRQDIAWQLGLDGDIQDDFSRGCEIRNWLETKVGAPVRQKSDRSVLFNYSYLVTATLPY